MKNAIFENKQTQQSYHLNIIKQFMQNQLFFFKMQNHKLSCVNELQLSNEFVHIMHSTVFNTYCYSTTDKEY
jgi:hypothetical protein